MTGICPELDLNGGVQGDPCTDFHPSVIEIIQETSDCGPDCNENGLEDGCETAQGTSPDCDNDGIPDECETDSDGDGVIDDCDQCPGYDDNLDEDGDGVPDDCEYDSVDFKGLPISSVITSAP